MTDAQTTDDEIVQLREKSAELRRRYIEAAWALRDTLGEIQQHAEHARNRARELRAEGYVIAADFIEYHLEDLADYTALGFADAAGKLIRVLGEPSPADAIALAKRFDQDRQRYRWALSCHRAFEEVAWFKLRIESAASEPYRAQEREMFDAMLPGISQGLRAELCRIEPNAEALGKEQVEAELRGPADTPAGLAARLAVACDAFGYGYDPKKRQTEKQQRGDARKAFAKALGTEK